MWKRKLNIGLIHAFGDAVLTDETCADLVRDTGFDGFFPNWVAGETDLPGLRKRADDAGMDIPFVHAPFGKIHDVWFADDATAAAAIDEQIACLRDCAASRVPVMVAHAFIGFHDHVPTSVGLDRFARLVAEAEKEGVKIAFENTEGEEFLFALFDAFTGNPFVGFCWDSGHEMCYNHSQDLLARLGDRLLAVHLNDNLGIRAFDGTTTCNDDLHLLPYDGIADWDGIARRLRACAYEGPLTFELIPRSKKARHENDVYAAMSPEVYLAEAYKRACRFAVRARD